MAAIKKLSTTATDVIIAAPTNRGFYNSVTLGENADGTITAGTLTVECKAPNAAEFEAPTVNTVDLSAPLRLQIEGIIQDYSFTITGFAGTATEVPIALGSFGAGQN